MKLPRGRVPNKKRVKIQLQKFSIFNSQIQERKPEKGRRVTKNEKGKPEESGVMAAQRRSVFKRERRGR